jgi:hypothetical protein
MCLTNYTNYHDKTFVCTEQICICVEQILQTTRTKHLYMSNKFYELQRQNIGRTKQIIRTVGTTMYTCGTNSTNYQN